MAWHCAFAILCLCLAGCGSEEPDPSTVAPEVDLESISISIEAAEQYLAGGSLVEAEAIAVRMLEVSPDSSQVNELLGRVHVSRAVRAKDRGDEDAARMSWAEASRYYEEATRLSPDSAGLHQSAGEVAQMAGHRDRAIRQYQAASAIDPENPRHPLYISQMFLEVGNRQEAREWVLRVFEIDPEQPHALATLAVIEMESGNWEEAIDAVTRARNKDPRDVGFRTIEAKIHRASGDPEHALELLLGLPESLRVQESVTWELAKSWQQLDRYDRAAEAWVRCFDALGGSRRSGQVALLAAEAWLQADQPERAAAWIDEAELLGVPADQIDLIRSKGLP